MKIIALVKYSMDVAEIRVDPATAALRMTGVPQRFGDLDKGAVEAAVCLKEATPDAVVEVLCFGPAEAKGAAKDLLAMGADSAVVIEDPYGGSAEAAIAVRVLEAALRKSGPFDIVVCGFASDDGYSYQTGPRLAERLGLPFVSYASQINLDCGVLIADRDLEEGIQTVSAPLPVVVSVAEEAFVPRTVTLLQAMKAQKKPTSVLTLEDLGLSTESLTAAGGYRLLEQTGTVVSRHQRLLKGDDVAELADRLIDALVEEEALVLKGGV
jgi:electron transfer flavoprotein beta subunit